MYAMLTWFRFDMDDMFRFDMEGMFHFGMDDMFRFEGLRNIAFVVTTPMDTMSFLRRK